MTKGFIGLTDKNGLVTVSVRHIVQYRSINSTTPSYKEGLRTAIHRSSMDSLAVKETCEDIDALILKFS